MIFSIYDLIFLIYIYLRYKKYTSFIDLLIDSIIMEDNQLNEYLLFIRILFIYYGDFCKNMRHLDFIILILIIFYLYIFRQLT